MIRAKLWLPIRHKQTFIFIYRDFIYIKFCIHLKLLSIVNKVMLATLYIKFECTIMFQFLLKLLYQNLYTYSYLLEKNYFNKIQ